jgi:uncharacterized repeat protein (TIGR02543 family)
MTVAFAVPGINTAPGQVKKQNTEAQALKFEFNDMTGYEWAMKSVQSMAAMGKIKGIGNGKFAPASAAKQIEVLIMTLRYLGLEDELDSDALLPPAYKGMKPQDWMIPYLELAIENDILTEEEAEDFNPNLPASRSLTAVYIIRALDMVDDAEDMQDDPLPYNDAAAVPEDRIGYVNLITELGLMIGHNNTFQPNKPLSRAEMAVLFERLYDSEHGVWHTITLKVEGDPGITKNYYHGQIISAPKLTKDNYNLNGWYTTSALLDEIDFPYEVKGDAIFFAEWIIKEFTVTFEENGGTTVAAIRADYNEKISEPVEPTKTGYTFGGWFYDDEFKDEFNFDEDKITGNITLYAKWIIKEFTITFDENGGTTVTAIKADYNEKITEPNDPTKTGYTFGGWFYDNVTFNNDFDFDEDKITGNITLYAKWIINQYTITFDTDGADTITPSAITLNYGADITPPDDPTREGFEFLGWDPELPEKMPASNLTLTAQWENEE